MSHSGLGELMRAAEAAATDLCANVRDLLDRTSLSCSSILGRNDETVGALAELLMERIVLIDDKRLLESLESVSLRVKCHYL
jgi:hypothetical protein